MTSSPNAVLLHVGYIKTATTFLQNQLFSGPAEGLELGGGDQTRSLMVQHFLLSDDYTFDPIGTRAALEQISQPVRARGNIPVWSEEMLLGNPPTRTYNGWRTAQKLHQTFPQAKVLITIRRQQTIAFSMYREYILGGGTLPLRSFIGTGQEPDGFSPILVPDFLQYDRAVAHFHTLFGAGNVCVLPQELLFSDPHQYFERLAEFTDCPIELDRPRPPQHVSESAAMLGIRRHANRLIVNDPLTPMPSTLKRVVNSGLRRLARVIPDRASERTKSQLKAVIAEHYETVFDASNARLEHMTGLDLAALGYAVETASS